MVRGEKSQGSHTCMHTSVVWFVCDWGKMVSERGRREREREREKWRKRRRKEELIF